jgi:site-specific recombinase XerD
MDAGKVIEKVSEFIEQKFYKENSINNTKKSYCSALNLFLEKHKNYSHLKDISDELILKYLLAIPGRSNRCNHHSAIKLMYRIHGFKNKMRFIPYPEKEDKLPIHVNTQEFLKMINVCQNEKHRAIISLMFDCGLRVSEVVNLKITDIDSSNMIINIIQGKGRKDRKVKLTKILLLVLRSYYSSYKPKIYLFNGQGENAQYSIRSCQEIVKQLTEKAGIKKEFTPHKFRHGYAMSLLENGATLSEIGNQMGHNSEKTTQIYARINNKIIQKIESPLEQLMNNRFLLNSVQSPLQNIKFN